MPLDPGLVALMSDTLVLEPVVKDSNGVAVKDKFGKYTFGPPQPLLCYIARENKAVRNRAGTELTSTLQAFLAVPETVVSTDDRITLPDGSHPAILEVRGGKNEIGEDYWLEILA